MGTKQILIKITSVGGVLQFTGPQLVEFNSAIMETLKKIQDEDIL